MHLGTLQVFKECCVNLPSQSCQGAVLKSNLNARQAAGLLADPNCNLIAHVANLMNNNTRTHVANLMHRIKDPMSQTC